MDQQKLEGEEGGLSSRSRDVYPDTMVKISCDQYSLFEIKRMAETTKKLVIEPEFQRHAVWKIEQKRKLIESVLINISIPVVYVFEDEHVKYVGSPEHKDIPSFAGSPRHRADASICDRKLARDRKKVQKWLQRAMADGCIGELWEGRFPRSP